MTEACHKVFVYGTLKKGQPNEYFMNIMENVEYLGVVETCTKYPLIIGGEWNLPMLLDLEGKGEVLFQMDLFNIFKLKKNSAILEHLSLVVWHSLKIPDTYF